MSTHPELVERIERLAEKYKASGQELADFLDGLLFADYLTYWDYVHLDTLLSLQTPRTSIPDERIFIVYHQITELYFKLALHELDQIAGHASLDAVWLTERVRRINRYFSALTHSFGVMEKGMDRDQFLQFRMSLIPASGFQSAQYRKIEIAATDFVELVDKAHKAGWRNRTQDVRQMFPLVYWKEGAIVEATGEKTLTLRQFELKYSEELIRYAEFMQTRNLWKRARTLSEEDWNTSGLRDELRLFDYNVNVHWPLQHYRTAVAYLAMRPSDRKATGGTNWQQYLPPRFQKRIFYPSLWSEAEQADWGKRWVLDTLAELGKDAAE
ncbi:tryptophan 2,3-dioxygenase [bacterium]|nr:tryptophan 2,3-dioxygenase [bacterium]